MKTWFTAAELAGLPSMPSTERRVRSRAEREGWQSQPRAGRGGGNEYAIASLPTATQVALLKLHGAPAEQPTSPETATTPNARRQRPTFAPDALNARWQRLTDSQRTRAEAKLQTMQAAIVLHERAGEPMMRALELAARGTPWSAATLRDVYYGKGDRAGLIDYPRHLWAMVLAPGYIGGTATAECDPQAWEAFKADFLRAEQPPLEMCHRTLRRLAQTHGWIIPSSSKSLKRKLDREVPLPAQILARKGAEALSRLYPPQIRERLSLRAMEAVNADGHKFDVFVRWPDGTIDRPMLVGWQDIRSGKLLSWRIDQTENSDGYRLSFADLLREHGIPMHVFVDNGRGIASKMLTGGMANRYRFKVRRDEPLGLLTQLIGASNIHWATPYHGQSKPIERAFRDLATDISKDYRLRGAYTGNRPDAKPENYQSHAAPLDQFIAVVEDGIRQHNARQGRRGLGMDGDSFDAVFAQSYERHAELIQRPTEAQLARWLLGAVAITAHKLHGAVELFGNRYWSEALSARLSGQRATDRKVIVRFDPDYLERPVYVETMDGRLIARAEPQGAVHVLSTQAARDTARDQKRLRKLAREQLDIHRRMEGSDLDQLIAAAADSDRDNPPSAPEQKVVRGVFNEPQRKVAGSDITETEGERNDAALARAIGPMLQRLKEGKL